MLYLTVLTVVLAAVAAFIYTKWKKDPNLKTLIKLRDAVQKANCGGICMQIASLRIDGEIDNKQAEWLEDYLTANSPTYNRHTEFHYVTGNGYWWPPIRENGENRQVRIDFLNKLIKQF